MLWWIGQPDAPINFDKPRPIAEEPSIADEDILVRAVVAEIAYPPAWIDSPEPDSMMMVQLTNVQSLTQGKRIEGQAIAHLWGLKDYVRTEAAEWRKGQVVMVLFRPWEQVEDSLEQVATTKLAGNNVAALKHFYGLPDEQSREQSVEDSLAPTTGDFWMSQIRQQYVETLTPRERIFLDTVASARARRTPPQEHWLGDDGWYMPGGAPDPVLTGKNGEGGGSQSYLEAIYEEPLFHASSYPAIMDYHRALNKAGIELILAPVPPKFLYETDRMLGDAQYLDSDLEFRPERKFRVYYDLLEEQGVRVVDLYPALMEYRVKEGRSPFLLNDHHLTQEGVRVVAEALADSIRQSMDVDPASQLSFKRVPGELGYIGSYWYELYPGETKRQEENRTRFLADTVQVKDGSSVRPVAIDKKSPVLLLGDSFTLFLGTTLTKGSDYGVGLRDQLSMELGFEIDHIGMLGQKGAGINGVRIEAGLDGDRYDGKKVVVWVIGAGALVKPKTDWEMIPLDLTAATGN